MVDLPAKTKTRLWEMTIQAKSSNQALLAEALLPKESVRILYVTRAQ
jgi:hypothetical protein